MIIVIIWSVLSFKFIDGLVLTVYCVKRYAYKNTLECLYKWKRYISRLRKTSRLAFPLYATNRVYTACQLLYVMNLRYC